MKNLVCTVNGTATPGLMMAGALVAGAWRRGGLPAAAPAEAAVALKRAYARRKPQAAHGTSWRSRLPR